jgi:hypothetical protein
MVQGQGYTVKSIEPVCVQQRVSPFQSCRCETDFLGLPIILCSLIVGTF